MSSFWTGLLLGGAAGAAGATLVLLWVRRAGVGDRPRLDRVLDALGEAVLVVDGDRVIRFANETGARFYPDGRAVAGRRLAEARGGDVLDALAARCLEEGPQPPIDVPGGADGTETWRAEAAPMEPEKGERFVRLILWDETERARTDRIRQEFVANASHELRTPLTIVQGYIENLLDGALEDTELSRRFLKIARKHTDRLVRLVEDMLSISRLESGEAGQLANKPFRLAKCLARVLDHLHALIESRQARITLDLDPAFGRLLGDRFYWEQVFVNLIENSLKNNPEPGLEVRLLARRESSGAGVIAVEDNGIGIPKEALPFVFKRFYRVQQHRSSEVPGTGLGLSIVRRAVEAHEGTVGVESEPGVRTAFTIRLPAHRVLPPNGDGAGNGGAEGPAAAP